MDAILNSLGDKADIALLMAIFIILAFFFGLIYTRRQYNDVAKERDMWRDIAFTNGAVSKKVLDTKDASVSVVEALRKEVHEGAS